MKELLPIIMEGTNNDTVFIDAFCGGCNVLSTIPLKNKIGIDNNIFIYYLWKNLSNKDMIINTLHDLPKNCNELTQEMYNHMKELSKSTDINNFDVPLHTIGYVGSACSYGGAWFNGYAKFNKNKNEDHIKEAYNGLYNQLYNFKHLFKTEFICMEYNNPYIYYDYDKTNTIIYCDPPYEGTKQYNNEFNSTEFWEWARTMSKEGWKIYISEYNAPNDFKCIWQSSKSDGMGTTIFGRKQNVKIEKLFVYNG